ncbi:MAG: hypothetical protein N5P05_003957 [Chroococcopsis gigantea SAG 12.99]|jgi:hypothetical protein|nr:DUF2808 domain-containing protein [Chlorogloea purpurea SAG 13.99]MDV3002351.1 hypothetical protein [Chroococcopsis gigantea SAG 12.99]
MKNIIVTSLIATLSLIGYANVSLSGNRANEARPSSAGIQGATHHLDYYLDKGSLTQMTIIPPEAIKVSSVEIKDYSSGKIIPIQQQVDGRNIIVTFSETIQAKTKLSIDLKGVKSPNYASTWQYKIMGKFKDVKEEIPLGTFSVRTY